MHIVQTISGAPERYAYSYSFGHTQAQDNAAKCKAMFDRAASMAVAAWVAGKA